ncbi:helix-turn-helix domain-containing protein [Radiobacillus sp. PE A8.2]|uniref:helix-turn-helix domain-containing protein n=1 Tax=Radiobacillus sp. PE A8.2 TaxID=3380349 RepID=UPI00388D0C69
MNNERSLSGIYHILSGKRSAQTIQDAHLFNLGQFFGIAKHISREAFDSYLNRLVNEGYLVLEGERVYLHEKANLILNRSDNIQRLNRFQGIKYDRISSSFSQRLILFIQTITNIEAGNHTFIPVYDDPKILNWVKRLYIKEKHKVKQWLYELYLEIQSFLLLLTDREATMFVDRLSGFHRIGLSKEQIANKLHIAKDEVVLLETSIVHQLIDFIIHAENKTPRLATFLDETNDNFYLSESTNKTNQLLDKGLTVDEIAITRGLKESTIFDHIVEIAYVDAPFNIYQFLSKASIEEINEAIAKVQTSKLKDIKTILNDQYSYFDIRLVLACYHSSKEREYIR